MANELTFRRPYVAPTGGSQPLVFNESGESFGVLAAEVRIGGLTGSDLGLGALAAEVGIDGLIGAEVGLGELAAEVLLYGLTGAEIVGGGDLSGLVLPYVSGSIAYDPDVPWGPNAGLRSGLAPGFSRKTAVALPLPQPGRIGARPVFVWAQCPARQSRIVLPLPTVARRAALAMLPLAPASQRTGGRLEAGLRAQMDRIARDLAATLYGLPARPAELVLTWRFLPRHGNRTRLAIGQGAPHGRWLVLPAGSGRRTPCQFLFPFGPGHRLGPGRMPRPLPPEPPEPFLPHNRLLFGFPVLPGNRLIFDRRLGWRIIVPILRTYAVANTFDLYRLSDGLRLPAVSAGVSTDADAWCWSANASLASLAAAEAVAPSSVEPVAVRMVINGTEWDFLVEDPEASEVWDQNDGTIRGRSLSAGLDEPYYPAAVFINTADRTVAQIAGDVLPEGVAVAVSLEDWLVPAGAWAFQATPVRALAEIAGATQAVLSSAKTGIGFAIDPRYPVLPWDWATAAVHATVPRRYFASRGRRWVTKPAYNLAIVAGEVGGVLGRIKRAGSAGDWPAPQAIHRLITAAAGARQRGESLLADTGRQALETIALPIGPPLGLVPLGALLEFEDTVTWRGLVRSVSVSAKLTGDALDVEQVIEVERHYA